jgi:hypothetical protein
MRPTPAAKRRTAWMLGSDVSRVPGLPVGRVRTPVRTGEERVWPGS